MYHIIHNSGNENIKLKRKFMIHLMNIENTLSYMQFKGEDFTQQDINIVAEIDKKLLSVCVDLLCNR